MSCGARTSRESVTPKYRCTTCGALWRLNDPDRASPVGSWSLYDAQQKPGQCCDNAAMVVGIGGNIEEVFEGPRPSVWEHLERDEEV